MQEERKFGYLALRSQTSPEKMSSPLMESSFSYPFYNHHHKRSNKPDNFGVPRTSSRVYSKIIIALHCFSKFLKKYEKQFEGLMKSTAAKFTHYKNTNSRKYAILSRKHI